MSDVENPPQDGDKNPSEGDGKDIENSKPGVDHDQCESLAGETDAGKTAVSLVWRAAAAAAAAAQSAAAAYISYKQFEIAKMMLDIARWWREWYEAAYAPLEDKEVEELYALKEYEPNFDLAMGRGKATVRAVLKGVLDRTMRCTSQYDTGLRKRILLETLKTEAEAVALGAAAGYRFERDRTDKLNMSRWGRFLGTVARGRDISAKAVSYGAFAARTYSSLGDVAAQGVNGLLRLVGYADARRPVRYNDGRGAYGGLSSVMRFERLMGDRGAEA
jgi:hypothetical protein